MLSVPGVPFWRLSGFYFFYFAVLGAWLPYWNLYLDHQGFDTVAIGILSAVVLGTKIVAPSLWGLLAERSGRHMRVIQVGGFLSIVALAAVFFQPGFWGMLCVVLCYSFFWNAILPQFEVVTIDHLGEHFAQYSKIRLWGSVGFIAAVIGLGSLFEFLAITTLPWLLLSLLGLMFICSTTVTTVEHKSEVEPGEGLRNILLKPEVVVFFVVVALQQFSHGPYYTFYSIYLEGLGYSTPAIGLLWSLGVLAEIVLFLFMHRLLPRFGIKNILICSLVLSVLRWLLIGSLAGNVAVNVFAQILHAASFGACHAVAIEFVRSRFGSRQTMGQAIYSGVSFGLGGALGAVVSGYLWHYGANVSFGIAAAASALSVILVWRYVQNTRTDTIEFTNKSDIL